ncbi:MAG: tRNA pseudouridine(13) synthase TruD [Thermoanaerobacteraceae bacterium]|nr:tRNA pseudouridine(13) synthase TruD [Thermoanaerobacteraceae bacterium]
MKIKVIPEDFIVKELINLKLQADGAYRIYLLEKRHWNTMDALLAIARQNKMPMAKIGYGGRKDRHAVTYQYISVPKEFDLSFHMSNIKLTFMGFADDFVSATVLRGNHFQITVRKIPLHQQASIRQRINEISRYGFPNFFDDQRFGSITNPDEILAERIIRKHYKGALKLYFTTVAPGDRRDEKQRKRNIEKLWGDWQAIAPLCKTKTERDIIKLLLKAESKQQLVKAINVIPKEELSMHFSAYQSYLWNLSLEQVLLKHIQEPFKVKGKIMDYIFYKAVDEVAFKESKDMFIPTVSYKIPGNPELAGIVKDILAKRELKPSDFNLNKIRKSFFKSFLRPAIVYPIWEDGADHEALFEQDDIYPGFLKLQLKFTLPSGSFATILIKGLHDTQDLS